MNVLVLGGSGYVGARLVTLLQAGGCHRPTSACRRGGPGHLRLDTRDEAALTQALRGQDAVVNCVAGSGPAIADGARALARAMRTVRVPALVHLSSMAVYGEVDHPVDESMPWGPARGWYARAKRAAEAQVLALAHGAPDASPRVTVLRPGCVWGPDSPLWVQRIARWLHQGRLGDLGDAGDGWTHGVTVDDVCAAIVQSLQRPAAPGVPRILNVAAPDSPRWNDWFTDLALAVGATPLRRIRPAQLQCDAWLAGPPLYLARRLVAAAGRNPQALPDPIAPGLLRLWRRSLRMDTSAATRELGLRWTPYPIALRQCVAALTTDPARAADVGCEPPGAAPAR